MKTLVDYRSAPIEIGPGSELGSWRLVSLLGEGAMGKVWRAEHARLGRPAAIKVLNAEYCARPDVVQRFFREARVVNDIDHENIVEVTDFVEAPGLAYLVMELLDGTSLRELMNAKGRKRPPLDRALAIMAQVCDALDAAHQKGVVHRDLKPDNVFVVKRGGADFVKVLDFGVAKLRDVDKDGVGATHTGVVLGTPLYMSPEQAVGRGVDRGADIWAAGVVLYELLAGKVPFTADSFVDLVQRIRDAPPDPLPAKTPRGERIPPALAFAVTKCLEKSPESRFRTMAALAAALRSDASARAPARWPRLLLRPIRALVVRPLRWLVFRPLRWLARPAAIVAVLAFAVWALFASGIPRRAATAIGSAWRSARSSAPRVAVAAREKLEGAIPGQPKAAPTPNSAHPERSAREAGAESRETPTASSTYPEPRADEADADSNETPTSNRSPTPAPKPQRIASVRPAEPAHPAARTVATVELHVKSTPSGATLVRLDTGDRLGKTPVRVHVPRKAATVWLRLEREGYQQVKFAVDLRDDAAANVTLHRAKEPHRAKKAWRRW